MSNLERVCGSPEMRWMMSAGGTMPDRPGFDHHAAMDPLFTMTGNLMTATREALRAAYDAGRASRAPEPDAVREEKERVVAAARKWRDGGHHMLSTALERLEAAEAAAAPLGTRPRFVRDGVCVVDHGARSQIRIWCKDANEAVCLAAAMNDVVRP